jgi:hypothetical protein
MECDDLSSLWISIDEVSVSGGEARTGSSPLATLRQSRRYRVFENESGDKSPHSK